MNRKRSFVSLLTALTFVVLAGTGILAFVRPFSLSIVGLHALMGFVFIGLIALHVTNNLGHLSRYVRTPLLWTTSGITVLATFLFFWQPVPIRNLLGLSRNLGPELVRFEMQADDLVYQYSPAETYKMALAIRAGEAFDPEQPPQVAIWLENASFYHIKTLYQPQDEEAGRAALPYWDFKVRGWEKALEDAEQATEEELEQWEVDAVSGPTRNSSFDPADYILPPETDVPMPYSLLVEINQPGDDQPSLVYSVEIDNADPQAYQLLELMGYPQKEEEDEEGKEVWALYYVDQRFDSALELIDSALLTIDRE